MSTEQQASEQGFAVGEIVELVYSRYHEDIHLPGDEVEIVEGFAIRYDWASNMHKPSYKIRHRGGGRWCVTPDQIRKKRPPREDLQLVRWDQCLWQPRRSIAEHWTEVSEHQVSARLGL